MRCYSYCENRTVLGICTLRTAKQLQLQYLRLSSTMRSIIPLPRRLCSTTLFTPAVRQGSTWKKSISTSRRFEASPSPGTTDPPAPRSSPPPTTGQRERLSFWPFLIIFLGGTGAFAFIVRSREGINSRPQNQQTQALEGPLVRKKKSQDES